MANSRNGPEGHTTKAPFIEMEMAANLRNLVDTCFDEGEYEAGMVLLENIMSPRVKPAHAHIRQLVYVALYPPPTPTVVPTSTTPGRPRTTTFNSPSRWITSPRKGAEIAEEREKRSLAPSPEASRRAVSLLNSFTQVSSAASILRGLPSQIKKYIPGDGWRTKVLNNSRSGFTGDTVVDHDYGADEGDSWIAKQAMDLTNPKDIWPIFAPGFIKRLDTFIGAEDDIMSMKEVKPAGRKRAAPAALLKTTPKRRSTRARKAKLDSDEDEASYAQDGENLDPNSAVNMVAESAWPVLDWLLNVYEKDEENSHQFGLALHSPLLLEQLPVSVPREDISTPLDLIISALACENNCGTRLMRLIINLTSPLPPHCLSPVDCLQATSSRFSTALFQVNQNKDGVVQPSSRSYELTTDNFQSFLASFEPSHTSFKLSFLCVLLTSQAEGDTSKFIPERKAVNAGPNPPKPARKRAASRTGDSQGSTSTLLSSTLSSSSLGQPSRVNSDPFPLPPLEDVLGVLSLQPRDARHVRQASASASVSSCTVDGDDTDNDRKSEDQAAGPRTHIRVIWMIAKSHILSCLLLLVLQVKAIPLQITGDWLVALKAVIQDGRLRQILTDGLDQLDDDAMQVDGDDEDEAPGSGLMSKMRAMRKTVLVQLATLERMVS